MYFFSWTDVEKRHLDGFWRLMAQKTRNRARICLLGYKKNNWNLTPYLPQNPPKWPWIGNFQPKWWNMKLQVYQKVLNQSKWKFNTMLGTKYRVPGWNTITSQQSQYGGRLPYWKSSFGYISTNDCPINAKFCRIKQNYVLTQAIMTKIPNFENSRWRTAAILKIVLSLYLSRKSTDFNEIW